MKFDITNLELDAVLVALHTAARVNNITFLDNKVPTLTHRMAREMIEEGQATGSLKFDRLMGRALHVDLNDDLVDLTRYGMNNGRLTGVQALYRLCQSKGTEAVLHMDDRTEPVTVTAEWLQSYDAIHNDDINFAYPQHQSLTQQLGRTKRPDADIIKARVEEAEFANRKQQLLDSGVNLPSAEDLANWRRRWEAATPAQREDMLHDDSVKYAYMHHRTLKDSAGQPIGEVGHPLDLLQRAGKSVASRSERFDQALLCDDNSDRELLGMAPRMVSIDVVRDSAIGHGKASDLDGSVDMSKPVDKGFDV